MSTAAARLRTGRPAPRELRVVRRRSRRLIKRQASRRVAPLALASVVLIGTIVVAVLLERVVLSQSAFELARLRKRVAAAEARHQELLLEAARLESPGRIERVARVRLGMVDPVSVNYIVADVGVPSSPLVATERAQASVEDATAIGAYGEDASP